METYNDLDWKVTMADRVTRDRAELINELQIKANISCHYNEHMRKSVKKLHWKYFKGGLLEMYQGQTLCDITVVAGDIRIPCHRMALAAGSKYFFSMFHSNMREAERIQAEVQLVGIDSSCLKAIIDFLYTGNLDVTAENAQALFEAANMLLLHPVQELVEKFCIDNLTPENCLGWWLLADHLNSYRLSNAAFDYAALHFVEVIANEEFLELDASKVHLLISHPDLVAASEDAICLAGLDWMSRSPELRAPMMLHVFCGIRFLDLTLDFIQLHLMAQPALKREQDLMQRFHDVANYIQFNEPEPNWLGLHPPRTSLDMDTSIVTISNYYWNVFSATRRDEGSYRVDNLCAHDEFVGPISVACVLNSVLYVCGVDGMMWSYRHNHNQQGWLQCAYVLDQRYLHGFTSDQNCKLYGVGGCIGTPYNVLTGIVEYNTIMDQWSVVGDLQLPVVYCAATFYHGSLYAIGGKTTRILDEGTGAIHVFTSHCNHIQQFNIATKTACVLAVTLPFFDYCFSIIVRDMLVVSGGNTIFVAEMATLSQHSNSVQWITKPWHNNSFKFLVVVVFGDKVVGLELNKDDICEASLDQLLDTSTCDLDWQLAGRLPLPMKVPLAAVFRLPHRWSSET